MTGTLFSLAILLALSALVARSIVKSRARRRREKEIASRPGFSAENPVRIRSFDEIDDAIATWRCPCGGLLDRIGEGSRPGVRVVRCCCVVCEDDVDLFFDLSQLHH